MIRWVWRIVCGLVTLAAVAAIALAVVVPRLAGATPYTVLTSSMRPGLPPGTLVVVRPVDAGEIGIGSVVTYQLKSGDPTVVTHRVVAQGFDVTGEPVFRTQGDANDAPDREWVRGVQVRGELWYAVPWLGWAGSWLTGYERQLGVYGIGGLLLLYAVGMTVGALRDGQRRRRRVVVEIVPRVDHHA